MTANLALFPHTLDPQRPFVGGGDIGLYVPFPNLPRGWHR
jgi:hypothetical protein